jgi:hypothetical protein
MKKIVSAVISIMYSLSIATGLVAVAPQLVHAESNNQTKTVAADTKKETPKASAAPVSYNYVAQAGDSYTLMARKAIQTYGIKNKVKISRAKIIAAETWLTQAAGSPYLDLAQPVAIQETTVKSFVDQAQKLSAADEAAWAQYVAGANFNTNAVGQQ